MTALRKLAYNTALLTASSLVMRCIAMVYQVWLVGRIGSDGIGLYQLVMSINVLSVTVAISGIRFTTSRLVSEELGLGNGGTVGKVMARCVSYSLFFGLAAFATLFLLAERIGFLWVCDARTVLSLKIISFGLPFISVSSVINGYFVATQRVYKSAITQILEQLVNISLVIFLLSKVKQGDLERSCAAISLGASLADVFAFVFIIILFYFDRRRHGRPGGTPCKLTARMLKIAIPLALSAYARTSLTTFENLLVPRQLRRSGLSANSALSGYGSITGMVFPIISFPSCLLTALAELIMPNLTEAQVRCDFQYIRSTVSKLIKYVLLFSILVSAFFFCTAEALGALIYKTSGIGKYIRIFSILIPIMYLDIITDGCLKGLGQMMYSMKINIGEALTGVILVIFLLPKWALSGYIAVLFICELLNFLFSFSKLMSITGIARHFWAKPEKHSADSGV